MLGLLNNAVDILLNGVVWGSVVVCTLTLIKSGIERLNLDSRYVDFFLRSCNSCFTFWAVLVLTFSLPVASVAWITSLLVQRLNS